MQYPLISLETARWRLARVWFIASAVIFIVLVAQSVSDVYESKLQGAWGWALPNFIPTLALMISVFSADALKAYGASPHLKVRLPFFKLSMGLSIFYVVVLLAAILAEPIFLTFRTGPKVSAVDLLQLSNLWLGPLQGLVVAALGVLFFLKEQEPGSTSSSPKA
jgi:hypothetical protein